MRLLDRLVHWLLRMLSPWYDEAMGAELPPSKPRWTAPPVFHDDGAYDIREYPLALPEEPKYIILYRGELTLEVGHEVASVLHALRVGDTNRFQANGLLYDISVRWKLPILFWATTYELYSGPVLEWND